MNCHRLSNISERVYKWFAMWHQPSFGLLWQNHNLSSKRDFFSVNSLISTVWVVKCYFERFLSIYVFKNLCFPSENIIKPNYGDSQPQNESGTKNYWDRNVLWIKIQQNSGNLVSNISAQCAWLVLVLEMRWRQLLTHFSYIFSKYELAIPRTSQSQEVLLIGSVVHHGIYYWPIC